MTDTVASEAYDVVVVGGGPTGISACLRLAKDSDLRILLLENEAEVGGIPRSAHVFFGMRDRKRISTGRSYADHLARLLEKTRVTVRTRSTVLAVAPGSAITRHQVHAASPQGMHAYESRYVVLATGCFEGSRESRLLAGGRPAGVFTTGALQKLVNLRQLKPGRRAVIIGSELVAFSAAMTLRHCGASIVGMVEEDRRLQAPWAVASGCRAWMRFPVYANTAVTSLLGAKRVEGVALRTEGNPDPFELACDTVVVTGKFRPESALLAGTGIRQDPRTLGPVVDYQLETSVPNLFAAGNVLRGANMHDLCALEGVRAAQGILSRLKSSRGNGEEQVSLTAEDPIRFVVPQKITATQAKKHRASVLSSGMSIQVAHTMKNAFLEAYSGDRKIWEKEYATLVANATIPLPVEKFAWNSVNPEQGIRLRCSY